MFVLFWISTFLCSSVCLFVSQSGCLWFCLQYISDLSQIFKNLLLWGLQWALSQEIIKAQLLKSGWWGCLLNNDPKLGVGKPNSRWKSPYWIGQHVYVIFCSELELRKVQTAVSKHLVILPNIRRGGNDATFWVETASSAIIIFFLVYGVLWHVLWWFSGEPIYWFSFLYWLFSTPLAEPTVL